MRRLWAMGKKTFDVARQRLERSAAASTGGRRIRRTKLTEAERAAAERVDELLARVLKPGNVRSGSQSDGATHRSVEATAE